MDAQQQLDVLLNDWDFTVASFKRIETKFLNSVSDMSRINKEIYSFCQNNNIDYSSLKLSERCQQ